MKDKNQKPDLSKMTMEETIAYFKSKGATEGKKTGAFLMPLSKEQREAMTKNLSDAPDKTDKE